MFKSSIEKGIQDGIKEGLEKTLPKLSAEMGKGLADTMVDRMFKKFAKQYMLPAMIQAYKHGAAEGWCGTEKIGDDEIRKHLIKLVQSGDLTLESTSNEQSK